MRRKAMHAICMMTLTLTIRAFAQDGLPVMKELEFRYPETANALSDNYFARSVFRIVELGKARVEVRLKKGEGTLKDEERGSTEVGLSGVFALDSEHAAAHFHVTFIGGSSSNEDYIQVFRLVDGHPVLQLQIQFNSDLDGTGATYEAETRTLTVKQTHIDPDTCIRCSGKIDVARYAWRGGRFQLLTHEVISTAKG